MVEPSHGTNYRFQPIQVPLGEVLKRKFSRNLCQKLIVENQSTKMREMRFSDEPNKWPLPQWFGQQPLFMKSHIVVYHMVIAIVPKIKSRKEKVSLSTLM